MTINLQDLWYQLPEKYRTNIHRHELILTGSWQYGTNTSESDFDLVLLHDFNLKKDIIDINDSCRIPFDEKSFTGQVHVFGAESEIDVKVLSYSTFIRKLFTGDINTCEYICSPYYERPSPFLDEALKLFLQYSLDAPFYRYKILKSILGFINPINHKKSKKFIIPEKVNQNNLIKIANLFYLIKEKRYPLNPELGMSMMRDEKGNQVELIDAQSPYYNSTEIMTGVLERHKLEMEEKFKKEIESMTLHGAQMYSFLLQEVYFPHI